LIDCIQWFVVFQGLIFCFVLFWMCSVWFVFSHKIYIYILYLCMHVYLVWCVLYIIGFHLVLTWHGMIEWGVMIFVSISLVIIVDIVVVLFHSVLFHRVYYYISISPHSLTHSHSHSHSLTHIYVYNYNHIYRYIHIFSQISPFSNKPVHFQIEYIKGFLRCQRCGVSVCLTGTAGPPGEIVFEVQTKGTAPSAHADTALVFATHLGIKIAALPLVNAGENVIVVVVVVVVVVVMMGLLQ